MKKILTSFTILFILSFFVSKTAYALFSDSVNITFDLHVGSAGEDNKILISNFNNKPLQGSNLLPGDWTEPGILEVTNNTEDNLDFYMHTRKEDGDVCHALIIKLERVGETTEVMYEGRLEELKGEGDRVLLADNVGSSESIVIQQTVQLAEDADKNDQTENCDWHEVFSGEDSEEETYSVELEDNIVSAGFWIPPSVEVKDPNDYELLEVGEVFDINWEVKSTDHDKEDLIRVDLYLYTDSGETLHSLIAEDLENDSKYEWEVPNISGDTFRIKIEAADGHGLTSEDLSDEDFEIEGTEEVEEGSREIEVETDIVISEIMWMGTSKSSSDEWIELKNLTNDDVNLDDWYIENVGTSGSSNITLNGTVSASSYFLIANYNSNHSNSALNNTINVDLVDTGVSLSNGGEQLVLKNSLDEIIDSTPTGSWVDGENSDNKRSMVRSNLEGAGIDETNWSTCTDENCSDSAYWDTTTNYGTPRGD